jgi:multiple sugar transport system permease protein
MFDVVWLMTEGGPLNTTTTLPVLIYRSAFKMFRVSQAAAISVIVFLILAIFVVLISRLESLKNLESED